MNGFNTLNLHRLFTGLLLCTPFGGAVLLHFLFNVSPITLIPENNNTFRPYCDNVEHGNSEINHYHNDTAIVFGYTLRKGYPYPYAGLVVTPDNTNFFDLHRYNHIKMTLKSSNSSSARFYIRTFQDSITIPDKVLSERYNGIQIPLTNTLKTHVFRFSELATPEWWFQYNNTTPSQISSSDFSRVTGIDFNNGLTVELNKPDTLTITELTLFRSSINIYIFFACICIFYMVSGAIFFFYKKIADKKRNTSKPVIYYKKIEFLNASEDERSRIVEFLATNFNDPELSVQKVSEAIALSAYKVPQIIKENFDCSFKEYLNQIRIEEAKRLLSTTDRQVTEIVFAVGYNSPPHFNRLFKSVTGKTPREYRDSNHSNI